MCGVIPEGLGCSELSAVRALKGLQVSKCCILHLVICLIYLDCSLATETWLSNHIQPILVTGQLHFLTVVTANSCNIQFFSDLISNVKVNGELLRGLDVAHFHSLLCSNN